MMAKPGKRQFALLALAATICAGLLVVVRSTSSADGYELIAVVENANGLIAGSQVRAGGVQIGTITDIELAADGYPHLTLQINEGYRVREGVTADVRLASVPGQVNRFVDLRNGRGDALPTGTTLGLGETDQPVEVHEMLELLTPEMQREVRTLVSRTERTLDDRGPDIERTLRVGGASLQQVAGLLDDVSQDRQMLRNLVRRASAGAAELASAEEDLSGTVTDAATLLDVAAARQAELRRTLRSAPVALEASSRLMRRVPGEVPQLRRTLGEASVATRRLGEVAQSMQRASTVAPETLRAARTVMSTARRQGPLFEELFTAIAPAVQIGAKAFAGTAPVLDQLRARTPDSINWLILLGAASSSYNAVGHGVRLTGTSVEAPRRLTSGCRAGLLPRPFLRKPGDLACEPWEDFASSFVGGGVDPERLVNPQKAASQDEGVR